MDAVKIGVADLAEALEEKKSQNQSQKVAVILGSRTGALFRSQDLDDDEEARSALKGPRSFASMSKRERFSASYLEWEDLKRSGYGRNMVAGLLESRIRKVKDTMADRFMADLVQKKIFRVILSFNPEDLLYKAFIASELKEGEDFNQFDLGSHIAINTLYKIHFFQGKVNACKLIDLFGDVKAFVQNLNRPDEKEKLRQGVKELLSLMGIDTVLMIGVDLTWDHIILSALPSRVKTVWFVNEDDTVKEEFRAQHQELEYFRFITGWQGEYENFIKALYFQINQGISQSSYELTIQVQKELSMIRSDLKIIHDVIGQVNDKSGEAQKQIADLLSRVDDIYKYIIDKKD